MVSFTVVTLNAVLSDKGVCVCVIVANRPGMPWTVQGFDQF